MKKHFALLVFLHFATSLLAQEPHEFQLRVGYGVSVYKTNTHLSYKDGTTNISQDTTDGAAAAALPIELRYQFHDRLNAGIDLKFGNYLYGENARNGQSNKFTIAGIAGEYLLVNAENTRVYFGLGANMGFLEMHDKGNSGDPSEDVYLKGPGFKANLGICYFIGDGPIALNFNLGYDSHTFKLDKVLIDKSDLDLSNFDGSIKVSGMEVNIGLILRLRH